MLSGKTKITIGLVLASLALSGHAQVVAVTNLAELSVDGSTTFSTTSFQATSFVTGDSSGGYTLTGISYQIGSINPGSNGRLSIYDANGLEPGTSLATFNTVGGATDSVELVSTPFSLAASTTYFVVFHHNISTGSYRSTESANQSVASTALVGSGWSIGDNRYFSSNSGTSWTDTIHPAKLSISVSAVPEPSSFAALAGLGVLGMAAVRRRRR